MRFDFLQLFIITTVIKSIKSSVIQSIDSSRNYTVEHLSVIFRHGDRTPDYLYPNDPYLNYDFSFMGQGGLTSAGKARAYELGTELRVLYSDFLGETYIPRRVMGRSSDYDRTKMSLMLVLSALYPPRNEQIWNPILNWQPIPIEYVPKTKDFIFMSVNICPLYYEEMIRVQNLNETQNAMKQFLALRRNLQEWTGKNISAPADMLHLYHTLMAEHSMGLKLPDWTKDIFPKGPLEDAIIFRLKLLNSNVKLLRLQIGMLMKNIIDTMNGIVNKTLHDLPNIQLFSGHDVNIVSILIGLGVFEPHVPQYTSAVIFELLLDGESKYYVGIRYYLGIPPVSNYLEIPECRMNPCPLDTFISLMTNLMPIPEEVACT